MPLLPPGEFRYTMGLAFITIDPRSIDTDISQIGPSWWRHLDERSLGRQSANAEFGNRCRSDWFGRRSLQRPGDEHDLKPRRPDRPTEQLLMATGLAQHDRDHVRRPCAD